METYDAIGTGMCIRAHRKKKYMTQMELAERVGTVTATVWAWEAGKSAPGLESCIRMCSIFGIMLDDLIKTEEETEEAGTYDGRRKRKNR